MKQRVALDGLKLTDYEVDALTTAPPTLHRIVPFDTLYFQYAIVNLLFAKSLSFSRLNAPYFVLM